MGSEGSSNDESWFSAAEHLASGALDAVGHAVEHGAEALSEGFQAAGATAEEAAGMISSESKAIPIVGAVVSAAEIGYHAGTAIVDVATGDLDGAADHALSMAEAAGNVATAGVLGMAEGGFDLGNAAAGGGEDTTAHHLVRDGLEYVGNAIGDAAYDALNPADSSTQ